MNHKELLFFLRLSEIFLRLGPYLVGFFLLKQLIAFTFYFRRGVDFFFARPFFLGFGYFPSTERMAKWNFLAPPMRF